MPLLAELWEFPSTVFYKYVAPTALGGGFVTEFTELYRIPLPKLPPSKRNSAEFC
jgi:hypothetical protein